MAAAAGGLLFLSDYPVRAWWLQLVAFLPFLYALERRCRSNWQAACLGATLGVFYLVPTLAVLELPLLMAAGLLLYMSSLWIAIAVGIHRVIRWPGPVGPLAAAAVVSVLEWVDFSALPIWGTAQCFARVWSAAPPAIQLVAWTGVTGWVFVLVAGQALLLALVIRPRPRVATALALIGLTVLVLVSNAAAGRRQVGQTVRVAAIGWTWEDLPRGRRSSASLLMEMTYVPLLEAAVAKGAELVVSPEAALRLNAGNRSAIMTQLEVLARTHGVWLFVGVFDKTRDDNRILFVDPRAGIRGEYRKTHLIPMLERYNAGDGDLVLVDMDGARIGGMICQDDNFTDLARAYGRRGAGLVVVPTNDWRQVKNHHLENSLFRGVENHYALVRAASNGISVIAAADGTVIQKLDHFETGAGLIVADLSISRGGTLYSFAGDWFVGLCTLLLAAGRLWRHTTMNASSRTSP